MDLVFDEKKYKKEYYLKNKEKIKEQSKKYYLKNKEKILEQTKGYQLKNKERIRERGIKWRLKKKEQRWADPVYDEYCKKLNLAKSRKHLQKIYNDPVLHQEYLKRQRKTRNAYYKKNKEHVRKVSLAWRNKNKISVNARAREFFKNNPEEREKKRQRDREYNNRPEIISARKAKWHEMKKNNPEEYKKKMDRHVIWCRNRRKTNMEYRLMDSLRGRLNSALRKRNVVKLETTMKLVGCSMPELIKHLEKQFKLGMSWENREKWHIDHIIPCISFDLSKLEEQRKCFHYTNLQPLWAHENYSKGKKIIASKVMAEELKSWI
jgi:hypothetical protein